MSWFDVGYNVSYSDDKHFGRSAYSISNDVSEIQKEIMTNGPVEGAFTVYADFPTYRSGKFSQNRVHNRFVRWRISGKARAKVNFLSTLPIPVQIQMVHNMCGTRIFLLKIEKMIWSCRMTE